jgi:hypothetical protein
MFKNNKQIIFIGLAIGVFFLIVIFLSMTKNRSTNLTQVNEIPTNSKNAFSVTQREPTIIDETPQSSEENANDLLKDLLDPKPTAVFVFTNEGWSPSNANINEEDYIKLVNLTSTDITVRELIPGQEAFRQPVIIKPNSAMDAQLKRVGSSGYWTFKEEATGKIGRVYLYPKP